MFTRVDLEQYNQSLEKLDNWLPMPHGGITTRPGLEFIGELKTPAARLIPFVYNTEQTYVIEAGNLYFRFYSEGARVVETAKNIVSISSTTVTVTGHGYTTGDWVVIEGVPVAINSANANGTWVITVTGVNTFTLDGFDGLTSGAVGTVAEVYQITTPYTTAQVADLRYAQDSNVLYLAHNSHAPRQLERLTSSTFAISNFSYDGGPFQQLNKTTSHTMTPSVTTGTGTLTSSTGYFTSAMVGMFIRVGGTTGTPAEQGFALITSRDGANPTTVVNITVQHTLSGATATDNWALGAWGSAPGFPGEVTLVGQRIVWGRTPLEQQKAWASAIGDLVDYSVSTNDDRAFQIVAHGNNGNVLRWLAAQKHLLAGTSGSEFSIEGSPDKGLTPTTANVSLQSPWGSSTVRPIQAGNSILYINRTGRKLREMAFTFEADGYTSPDLSLLARHILETNPVTAMAYQQERDGVVYFALNDGSLATMTWLKDQKVVAWAHHTMNNAWINDVVAVPNDSATFDEVYFSVTRTIGGGDITYLERLSPSTFVDSNLQGVIDGRNIFGLEHLNGEEVAIVGDGAVYRNKTVVDGRVTVDSDEPEIEFAIVGLPITATAIPVEPEIDDGTGTSFSKRKRWVEVNIRATDTMTVGINGNIQDERSTEDLMDEVPDFPTIQDFKDYNFDYDDKGKVTITQSLPLPATVLGMFGIVELGD